MYDWLLLHPSPLLHWPRRGGSLVCPLYWHLHLGSKFDWAYPRYFRALIDYRRLTWSLDSLTTARNHCWPLDPIIVHGSNKSPTFYDIQRGMGSKGWGWWGQQVYQWPPLDWPIHTVAVTCLCDSEHLLWIWRHTITIATVHRQHWGGELVVSRLRLVHKSHGSSPTSVRAFFFFPLHPGVHSALPIKWGGVSHRVLWRGCKTAGPGSQAILGPH